MSRETALYRISEQIEAAVTSNYITPATMGEVLREIVNIVPRFTIYKASFNAAPTLQAGDVITGLWDDNRYIVAKFNGGDESNLDSYTIGVDQTFETM